MRELQVEQMPPISLKGKDRPVPYYRLAEGAARNHAPRAGAAVAQGAGAGMVS
jgi:class 3 adenylate cyclase